jgi:hypothetical protein
MARPGCTALSAGHDEAEPRFPVTSQQTMTNKQTLTALFAAVALSILGSASVAQAGNQGEDTGGFVIPGSTDGVNPVYHPGWFGKAHNAGRAHNAFAYAPAASPKRVPSHTKARGHD